MNKYEIRKLGEVEHFLGVRIVRDWSQRKLWLVQDSYIDKIAKKYNITLSTKPPKNSTPNYRPSSIRRNCHSSRNLCIPTKNWKYELQCNNNSTRYIKNHV